MSKRMTVRITNNMDDKLQKMCLVLDKPQSFLVKLAVASWFGTIEERLSAVKILESLTKK